MRYIYAQFVEELFCLVELDVPTRKHRREHRARRGRKVPGSVRL